MDRSGSELFLRTYFVIFSIAFDPTFSVKQNASLSHFRLKDEGYMIYVITFLL